MSVQSFFLLETERRESWLSSFDLYSVRQTQVGSFPFSHEKLEVWRGKKVWRGVGC